MKRAALMLCLAALCGCSSVGPNETEYNRGVDAYRMKDYASARRHWAIALEQGDPTAGNNLGYLLYYGLGGAPDMGRALALWTKAAHAGIRESQWHLGQAFEEGKALEKNLVEAYAWYRCAAEGAQGASGSDDLEANIAQDASASLTKLLPRLSPAEFEAGEKLAKRYIADFARPAAH